MSAGDQHKPYCSARLCSERIRVHPPGASSVEGSRQAGRMPGGGWVLQRRLAAFTCLFVIFTLSSHRLILASQLTFSLVSRCWAGPGQPPEFIRIPGARDGSSDPWRTLGYLPSIAWSTLRGNTSSSVGKLTSRVMYWKPVQLKIPLRQSLSFQPADRKLLSFSTTFVVSPSDTAWVNNGTTVLPLKQSRKGVEGLAFIIVPDAYTVGDGGGYLGFLNSDANASSTTSAAAHTFGVELDFVKNKEFRDADPNHVGIDIGSMTSVADAPITGTVEDSFFRVWIEYHSPTRMLEVRVASPPDSHSFVERPDHPTLATHIDLSTVLLDFMHIGFSSAVRSCEKDFSDYKGAAPSNFSCSREVYVDNWCFHTFSPDSNASVLDCPIACPSSGAILSRNRRTTACVASVLFLALVAAASLRFYFRWDDRRRWRFDVDANIEEGPHRFSYKELKLATLGFSPKQSLGRGGFGSVYKGFLPGNQVNVAVKRVAHDSKQGEKEFLAEVQIIGKVRHKHLVRLQGWCHERGELLLVYDYLPGGSVDRILFKDKDDLKHSDSNAILFSWENRWKAVQGIAAAVAYLHEECDQRIVHRDIKASNVMLDAKMNAKLGDFGLARSYQHSMLAPESTIVAGTLGYLAPELFCSGKCTYKSDIYSCGMFFLEVACGRRPIDPTASPDQLLLLDWVWRLFTESSVLEAADPKLHGEFDSQQMMLLFSLALLCCHPDPEARPSMRHVVMMLKGEMPVPTVPTSMPGPNFERLSQALTLENGSSDSRSAITEVPDYCDNSDLRKNLSASSSSKYLKLEPQNVDQA